MKKMMILALIIILINYCESKKNPKKILVSLFSPASNDYKNFNSSFNKILTITTEIEKKYECLITWIASNNQENFIDNTLKNLSLTHAVYAVDSGNYFSYFPNFISKLFSKNLKFFIDYNDITKNWCLGGFCDEKLLRKIIKQYIYVLLYQSPDLILTDMDPIAYIVSYISNVPILSIIPNEKIFEAPQFNFYFKWFNSIIFDILKDYIPDFSNLNITKKNIFNIIMKNKAHFNFINSVNDFNEPLFGFIPDNERFIKRILKNENSIEKHLEKNNINIINIFGQFNYWDSKFKLNLFNNQLLDLCDNNNDEDEDEDDKIQKNILIINSKLKRKKKCFNLLNNINYQLLFHTLINNKDDKNKNKNKNILIFNGDFSELYTYITQSIYYDFPTIIIVKNFSNSLINLNLIQKEKLAVVITEEEYMKNKTIISNVIKNFKNFHQNDNSENRKKIRNMMTLTKINYKTIYETGIKDKNENIKIYKKLRYLQLYILKNFKDDEEVSTFSKVVLYFEILFFLLMIIIALKKCMDYRKRNKKLSINNKNINNKKKQ